MKLLSCRFAYERDASEIASGVYREQRAPTAIPDARKFLRVSVFGHLLHLDFG
jgi:hypothetical protein